MSQQKHFYGGQAVIEGVMIRGLKSAAISVRRPDGEITCRTDLLHPMFTGRWRRAPLVRGVLVLIETLVLGMKALTYSADVSLGEESKEVSKWAIPLMLVVSMTFGIGLFFLAPLFAARSLDSYISSSILSNFLEGVIRLALFLAYVSVIGLMPDIRRVFAYHGAEHMTVHAYEHNESLDTASVRKYSTAHPRCGTAFLLVVMVIAIVVFAFLGRPNLVLSVISRVVLLPVIAAVSYEVIRFSGAHAQHSLVRLITAPSLALQSLTTREPDDDQIEVAIHAMKQAIAGDEAADSGESLHEEAPASEATPGS